MFLISIAESEPTPRGLKRHLGRIRKAVLTAMAEYWHRNLRRKHFSAAGAREYGYLKRKGEELPRGTKAFRRSYTGRKLAKYGHTRPLVYTGVSLALSGIKDIRSTSKRARVVLHCPGLNRRHASSSIRMYDELTRLSASDQRVLTDMAQKQLELGIKTIRGRRKKRLSGGGQR
jgi:hypothetical protein